MRKQIYLIGALATLAFTSCQKDDLGTDFNNDPNAVRIHASVAEGIDITRSNPLGDAAAQKRFNQDDKICVSVSGQEPVTYTMTQDGATWTPEVGKYLKWESSTMEFSAYYPVERDNSQDHFLLPTDQSDLTKLVSADYMTVDKQTIIRPNDGASASIKLNRANARVIVNISSFGGQYTGTPTVSNLMIYSGVQQHGPSTSFYPVAVTPYMQNGTGGVNTVYTAIVIPAAKSTVADLITLTDSEGNNLNVKGIPWHYPGKSYTYNLIVGKDGITVGSVTVKDWNDEVVIPGGDAEENLSVWDGMNGNDALQGLGTADNPFTITSAAQLASLTRSFESGGNYANDFYHYRLDTSIDLAGHEWKPIGTNYPFRGVFDGNGYYIKGLKITNKDAYTTGLFSQIYSKEGKASGVKNLRIIDAVVELENNIGSGAILVATMQPDGSETTNQTRGFISDVFVSGSISQSNGTSAALVNVLKYVDVTNCKADIRISSTYSPYTGVGGLVAWAKYATFTNCEVTGSVSGRANAGGFVASVDNSTLTKCVVKDMTVTAPYPLNEGEWNNTGGFAGEIGTGTTIDDCHVINTTVSSPSKGGGFAGNIFNGSSATAIEVKNCTVSGSVTGSWTLGGFVANAYTEGLSITIDGCSTSSSILTNNWNVGGFAGWSNAEITDCTASGNITSQPVWGSHLYKTGGFVGTNAGTITRSTYSGTMTYADDAQYYGGFVGNSNSGTTIGCRFDGAKNSALATNGLSVNNEAIGTNEISNSID